MRLSAWGRVFAPGQRQDPGLMKSCIPCLGLTDSGHLVNRTIHCEHESPGLVVSVALLQHRRRHRELGGAPAAISTGRPKADDLFFQNSDFQLGVRTEQIVGCPQTGITAAENGNIDVNRSSEWRTRSKFLATSLQPKTALRVVSHIRDFAALAAKRRTSIGWVP